MKAKFEFTFSKLFFICKNLNNEINRLKFIIFMSKKHIASLKNKNDKLIVDYHLHV